MTMELKDNFLEDDHLKDLDKIIDNKEFPWYLQKEQIEGADDGCWFCHVIYDIDEPRSPLYNPMNRMFKSYLKYVSLCRITVNLLLKQENPTISAFHVDYEDDNIILNKTKMTTAIFYLNTNNGATELKDGDRIDCVRNRLIMFPTNTYHRVIGQTDVSHRIVLNFNFIM